MRLSGPGKQFAGWNKDGTVVDEIVSSMGKMNYGQRPPAWVLVFPAPETPTCSSKSEAMSQSEVENTIKEVLSNPSFFSHKDAHDSDSPRNMMGGYDFLGGKTSIADLDEIDDKLKVTPALLEAYRKMKTAKTKSQLRQFCMEMTLLYLSEEQCGLNARCFSSQDGSEVYVAISASEQCLTVAADCTDYSLQFRRDVTQGFLGDFHKNCKHVGEDFHSDEPFVKYDLQEDFKFRVINRVDGGKLHCSPFRPAQDDPKLLAQVIQKLEAESRPCLRFNWALNDLENGLTISDERSDDPDHYHTIFRSTDRIRLVRNMIERLFSLDALEDEGIVSVAYCCHDQMMRRKLEHDWASMRNLASFYMPLDEIRDYCGENIAFRFAFMQFVVVTIFPLAVISPFLRLVPRTLHPVPVFGVLMFLWMQLMQKYWSRLEAALSLRWGMEARTARDEVRAKFKGRWVLSEINGFQEVKISDKLQPLRQIIAKILTGIGVVLMITSQVALLSWKIKYQPSPMVFSLINAVQVQAFRVVWRKVALAITHFENHRHLLDFQSTYSARIFWFMLLNTMMNFAYLSYVKVFVVGCRAEVETGTILTTLEEYFYTPEFGKCGSELAYSLIVFLAVDFALEIRNVLPYIKFPQLTVLLVCPCARRKAAEIRGKDGYKSLNKENGIYHPEFAEPKPGFVEIQRHMPDFDFDEQAITRSSNLIDICIIAFFGIMVPEIVALLILATLIRMRMFGRRLIHVMRRPYPLGSSGIAFWNRILGRVFLIASLCNMFTLILHYSTLPEADDIFLPLKKIISTEDDTISRAKNWKAMLAVCLFLENVLILPVMLGVQYYIADESHATGVHRKRQQYVAWVYNKLLSDTTDKGEMSKVKHKLDGDRMFYVKDSGSGGLEWKTIGNKPADISSFAEKFWQSDASLGWCDQDTNLVMPGNQHVNEDRLFAKTRASPWGLSGCCL